MSEFRQIALLIDADNTQPQKMDAVVELLSERGRIAVRRAFGNWSKDSLKAWIGITKRLSIKAEQQFDYVADKNATDMALAIAALDLLHRGDYDAFAIVSSDSDFTPLAIYLREAGVHVIGIGKELTPTAFRNSCDEFIYLEPLEPVTEKAPQAANEQSEAPQRPNTPSLASIHRALRALAETRGNTEGYVASGDAGNYLQKLYPGFKIKHCGFSKFSTFFAAYPDLYQTRKEGNAPAVNLYYRCLAQEDEQDFLSQQEEGQQAQQEENAASTEESAPAMEFPCTEEASESTFTLEAPEEISTSANHPACKAQEEEALEEGTLKAGLELSTLCEQADKAPPMRRKRTANAQQRAKASMAAQQKEDGPFILKSAVPPEELHQLLKEAAERHAGEDGFTLLSLAGAYIRRKHPDFNVRLYKHPRLSGLLRAFPEHYELRQETRNGIVIVFYKCV